MSESPTVRIAVAANGPYLVSGPAPLAVETIGANAEGQSWEWIPGRSIEAGERYALCRCGRSENKPFCDGAHARTGFDGTETASHEPFDLQAETVAGPELTLHDVKPLCAWARFCDNGNTIWKDVAQTGDPDTRDLVEHEAGHCPSGRLVLRDASGAIVEPNFGDVSIALVQDPGKDVSGPLYVRGGVSLTAADGRTYERRNRVTLCRCGASANKPFCDGSHVDVGFRDGL